MKNAKLIYEEEKRHRIEEDWQSNAMCGFAGASCGMIPPTIINNIHKINHNHRCSLHEIK